MKKVVGVLILFLCFQISSCKNESEKDLKVVEELFKSMLTATKNKDYDFFIETTHPKVFETDSKEQSIKYMKSVFEGNENFSIVMFYNGIPSYNLSEVYNDDENKLKYAFVSYDSHTKMIFHKQKFDEVSKKNTISAMKKQGMDAEFISDNTINILMRNRVSVIMKNNETNNKWIIVNYEPGKTSSKILSHGLLNKTKKYLQKLNSISN